LGKNLFGILSRKWPKGRQPERKGNNIELLGKGSGKALGKTWGKIIGGMGKTLGKTHFSPKLPRSSSRQDSQACYILGRLTRRNS